MSNSELKSVWASPQSAELNHYLCCDKVMAEIDALQLQLGVDEIVVLLSQTTESLTSGKVYHVKALQAYQHQDQFQQHLQRQPNNARIGQSLAALPDLCEQLLAQDSADINATTSLLQRQITDFVQSRSEVFSLSLSEAVQIGNTRLIFLPLKYQLNWQLEASDGVNCPMTKLNEASLKLASEAELARVSQLLTNKEAQYLELFQQLPVACSLIDKDNCISSQNQVASQIFPSISNQSLYSLINADDHILLDDCLHIVRDGALHQSWCEVPLVKAGVTHWYKLSFCRALDIEQQLLMMIEDVSERYRLADELSFQSNYDPLTGLPNRLQFEAMLEELIEHKDRLPVCVAFMDLDQFQVVNDISGHQAGDELLRQVSKRLSYLLRHGDVVARLGGDEFGILMFQADKESAEQVGNRICQQLSEHEFIWGEVSHNIGVSMGMTQLDAKSEDIYRIMSQADAACRIAKEDGRNRWHFYSKNDPQVHHLYNQMLASVDIVSALALNQFELFYQLIEPLNSDDRGIHMEILLRMVQEDGRFVSPGVFLPAAERYNLASKIDSWVIDNLLKWGARNSEIWSQLSMVSLNLSALSLSDSKFMDWLEIRLMVEPELVSKLCFEITETAAISQLEQATTLIELLKPLGCKLALDDFGSGFSSFAYLKCLDVDYVKIDGQFVVNVCDDRSDKAIVSAICQLGKDMDFKVIGEFVESADIGRQLKQLGVSYGQGYAIGKPTRLQDLSSGIRTPWLIDL
ncbi:EAL domain-containing protein [Pseudomonadota bacterium]